MKDIILKVPDEFSDEQVDFIKRSAVLQIEAEIRKTLVVPQADIDAMEAKISSVKEAMSIQDALKEAPGDTVL